MKLLIYGYGAMTAAMVEGWLRAGMPPSEITAYNPRLKAAPEGVTMVTEAPAGAVDMVVLGFKPAMLAEIAPRIEALAGRQTVVLSVLAGVDCDTLALRFPRAAGLVRFMPNLAVALGKSPNALIARGLGAERRAEVTRLAEMLGGAEWIEHESQFDLIAALVASGPAFVYRFIDALAVAATELGLESAQAQRLAVRMVDGAAALAASADVSPGDLANRVASSGGMTRKGLDVLDADGALIGLVKACLRAARDRATEMGERARANG